MNQLDLPVTREEITAWVLSLPPIKLSLVNTTLDNLPYHATRIDVSTEIIAWAKSIQKQFPDLCDSTTDPILPFRDTVTIANTPIYHRHKSNPEHP